MELKFEAAPFPAVTLCNLNAWKYSSIQDIHEMRETMTYFTQMISKRSNSEPTEAYDEVVEIEPLDEEETAPELEFYENERKKRDASLTEADSDTHSPVYVTCRCKEEYPCLCQRISNLCVQKPLDGKIPWFKLIPSTVKPTTAMPTTSTISQEIVKSVGITENTTDKGTMTTKTKQHMISIGASLGDDVKTRLSYSLQEFVLSCSFNSEDCQFERDFKLHLDPVYGNCYTFNYNDSVTLKNSRAGPMYGLRLLLNINQSDYLPITEAAGVRLVVHEQDMEPFPDTFGYSAPVGFVSSFGLKTKIIHRLGPPYGLCRENYRPKDYIYGEYYSSEGCYRSCFQSLITKNCGCGDPRFPVPKGQGKKPCKELHELNCLQNLTKVMGNYYHIQGDCDCVQPCQENSFETAYSAAAWPSDNCYTYLESCPNDLNDTLELCTGWLRKNTAFIEVYYEQLNFETLKEKEAYTIVDLLSDFGGNIGLWIGFSAITVVEWVELILECFYFCYYHKRRRTKRKKKERYEMHYVNTNAVGEHRSLTQANKMGLIETDLG